MDRETLEAYRRTARDFARKELEGRSLRDALSKAEVLGLFDSEFGVWGSAYNGDAAVSCAVLEELAKVDPSFALAVHAICLCRATGVDAFCSFDKVVIYADAVPARVVELSEGKLLENCRAAELSPRTGLRGCGLARLEGYEEGKGFASDRAGELLRYYILGICSVALGNAEGAFAIAREYASQRYQGCTLIKDHDAVRLLLGEALSKMLLVRSSLERVSSSDAPFEALLSLWLMARGMCLDAVSNCMQVLGGYGYMEDFGVERRLRDAMTIRGLPPSGKRAVLRLIAYLEDKLW